MLWQTLIARARAVSLHGSLRRLSRTLHAGWAWSRARTTTLCRIITYRSVNCDLEMAWRQLTQRMPLKVGLRLTNDCLHDYRRTSQPSVACATGSLHQHLSILRSMESTRDSLEITPSWAYTEVYGIYNVYT